MSVLDLHKLFAEFKEESQLLEGTNSDSNILIVDALNIFIRSFAAAPTMDDNGDHVGGITGFLQSVGAAVRMLHPTRVILVFDGSGGSTRRRKIFPDYKGQRKGMSRLNRTYGYNSIEEEQKRRRWQMTVLIEILQYLPVTVFAVNNVEADDVIAYLTNINAERENKTTIMSTDKDFLQLVSENVKYWNPAKKRLYGPEEVLREYEVHPHNFVFYRIMDGDKSDNIPGIERFGISTVRKFFTELQEPDKKSLDFIIEKAKITESSVCKKIADNRELLEMNMQLMRLDDPEMSGTIKIDILDKFDNPVYEFNHIKVGSLFTEYKLMGAFRGKFNEWMLNTWSPLMRFVSHKQV